jgi:hypothetical protein
VEVWESNDADTNETLKAKIVLSGTDCRFPSSNELKPYRFIGSQGSVAIGVRPSREARTALDIISACYKSALNTQRTHITFAKHPVQCLVAFPETHGARRWDHHNQIKMLADWLQDMRIIADDSLLDIVTVRLKDYPTLQQSGCVKYDATTIFLSRRSLNTLWDAMFHDFARHCDGKLEVIG